nr:hypothetical protein CFP56_64616 [Quercus suber]
MGTLSPALDQYLDSLAHLCSNTQQGCSGGDASLLSVLYEHLDRATFMLLCTFHDRATSTLMANDSPTSASSSPPLQTSLATATGPGQLESTARPTRAVLVSPVAKRRSLRSVSSRKLNADNYRYARIGSTGTWHGPMQVPCTAELSSTQGSLWLPAQQASTTGTRAVHPALHNWLEDTCTMAAYEQCLCCAYADGRDALSQLYIESTYTPARRTYSFGYLVNRSGWLMPLSAPKAAYPWRWQNILGQSADGLPANASGVSPESNLQNEMECMRSQVNQTFRFPDPIIIVSRISGVRQSDDAIKYARRFTFVWGAYRASPSWPAAAIVLPSLLCMIAHHDDSIVQRVVYYDSGRLQHSLKCRIRQDPCALLLSSRSFLKALFLDTRLSKRICAIMTLFGGSKSTMMDMQWRIRATQQSSGTFSRIMVTTPEYP